ncbi:MAG: hypothetical protein HY010_21165 [Acidobacteria bacterium]|nr:hypothetical protein [Acidobacteriota bacterium]
MSVGYKGKAILAVILALHAAALAKPTHVLYHAGKSVAHSTRHPRNMTRGLWNLLKVVF